MEPRWFHVADTTRFSSGGRSEAPAEDDVPYLLQPLPECGRGTCARYSHG